MFVEHRRINGITINSNVNATILYECIRIFSVVKVADYISANDFSAEPGSLSRTAC